MVMISEINDQRTTGYEKVVRVEDKDSGLVGFIAVHNSKIGHARNGLEVSLGGLRMNSYASEDAALTDVLRLSEGMTKKSAAADDGLGGAKAVIIGDAKEFPPGSAKRKKLMHAMGEAIEQFAQQFPLSAYVTAEDVGTNVEDMRHISEKTTLVSGIGHGEFSGNPSPFTALGVLIAMKETLGVETMKGKRVAISGTGNVGGSLARLLHAEGATLVIADKEDDKTPHTVAAKAEALKSELGEGVTTALSSEIHKQDVDVYAPCAMGACLDDNTIPEIKAKYVIGAANNQLAEARHGKMLHDAEKIYVPDFIANAGGVIAVGMEVKHRRARTNLTTQEIEDVVVPKVRANTKETLKIATERDMPLSEAGEALARERLAAADQSQSTQWAARPDDRPQRHSAR